MEGMEITLSMVRLVMTPLKVKMEMTLSMEELIMILLTAVMAITRSMVIMATTQ